MEKLNLSLEQEHCKLSQLKLDLGNIEDLLEEPPCNTDNIIASIEKRETQMEQLQAILPKLWIIDTQQLRDRAISLINDKLYIAFEEACDSQNNDLV